MRGNDEKTEVRRQETGDRRQETGDRRQKTEDRMNGADGDGEGRNLRWAVVRGFFNFYILRVERGWDLGIMSGTFKEIAPRIFSAPEDLRGHGGILKIGFDDAAREQGDFVFCKRVSQIKVPDPFFWKVRE